METILATAFGRKVDVQGGEADELTKAARSFFTQAEEGQLSSRELLVMLNSESFSHAYPLHPPPPTPQTSSV
jgi:hypothetical protein